VAGLCGVPATATAVAVNLTVVNPSSTGHLRVAGEGAAALSTSSINFKAQQILANNGIFALSDLGTLSVYCSMSTGSVHLLVDVFGYLE
jgi:hypothetical protein